MTKTTSWETLADAKRKAVRSKIPLDWILPNELLYKYDSTSKESVLDIPAKFLSPKELDITENHTPAELLDSIKASKISSLDAIKAFSHRAAIATQLTNCCTEIMFEYGIKRAKFLDNYLIENKKPYGLLHGLPISLKDSFNVPGYDSTIGYVKRIGNMPKEESDLVKLLLDLGANFYVKTNIPQTLMTADSENNIFGRTLNPGCLNKTAGGSSGGEGALIQMRGSILGFGTDIAGSIRIPSLCCGVYGYRPSAKRIPVGNEEEPSHRDPHISILPVAGPLSTDMESLVMVTKSIIDHKPWNYGLETFRIPYQDPGVSADSKLRIGFIFEDPNLPVHPPLKRILKEAKEKLSSVGHNVEIIDNHPSFDYAWELAWKLFQVDAKDSSFKDLIELNEKLIKSLTLPGIEVYGEGPKDINGVINLKEEVQIYTFEWLTIFKDYDVIIAPGAPSMAPPHDTYGIAPYTGVWNLVDFPATIIPFGNANANIDKDDGTVYPEKLKHIYAHYDPETYDGAIGHVQVVAPHLEDEKLLACSVIIDKVLNAK
ncbi:hypothetical protein CANINC_002455 [Pichia inconspicua]|uniref:Amidase domain-containing protein n=1 Tax=Pichia inconspicua TaxID=52247 RepID=A0A4T0X2D5_9ASCO|nr:hypothetical protein CANINC_002455 [[Candida] inconspicua]